MTVSELCNRVLRTVGGQEPLRLTAFGVGVFAVVNIPSLKMYLGASSLVNVVFLGGLVLLGVRRVRSAGAWRLPRERLWLGTGLLVVLALTVAPDLAGLRRPAETFLNGFGQMLFLVLATTVISIFATADDARTYVTGQIVWGTMVGALVLAGVIRYAELEGQPFHYNTVALPIALATVGVLSLWMGSRRPRPAALVCSGVMLLINMLALLQLPSRISLIGVPLCCVAGIGLSLLWGGPRSALRQRLLHSAALLAVFVLAAIVMYTQTGVSQLLLVRTARLLHQGSTEPRMAFLPDTVATILVSPFGYGLNKFPELTAYQQPYPHNLILDALLSGGWLVGVIFSGLVLYPCIILLQRYRRNHGPPILTVGLIATHLLLNASTSYSWMHSYMLFGILALCFALRDEAAPARS